MKFCFRRRGTTVREVTIRSSVVRGKSDPRDLFPADGFCSELTVLNDGRMVEVATIGREGVVGLLGGSGRNPVRSATMVQGPGAAVTMPVLSFRRDRSSGR